MGGRSSQAENPPSPRSLGSREGLGIEVGQLVRGGGQPGRILLVLDKHAVEFPATKDPKSNRWHFGRSQKMVTPEAAQFERVKVQLKLKAKRESFLAEMKQQQDRATELYELVKVEHPGTPWSRRADWELNHGYGMEIHEGFHDPNYKYVGSRIKIPKF